MPAIWNPDAAARTQRLHRVWIAMRSRCHTPSNPSYKDYGGRGIAICEAWADFGVFREWAFSADYKEGKGLECAEAKRIRTNSRRRARRAEARETDT